MVECYFIAKEKNGPFVRMDEELFITDVDGNALRVSGNAVTTDSATKMLHDMAVRRAKGDAATVYVVRIFTAGNAQASMRWYTWFPETDEADFSGKLLPKGDAVLGNVEVYFDDKIAQEMCNFNFGCASR